MGGRSQSQFGFRPRAAPPKKQSRGSYGRTLRWHPVELAHGAGICSTTEAAQPLRSQVMDPYAVLGVHPEATLEEIRRQYTALALQLHPDKRAAGAAITAVAANCSTTAAGELVDAFQQLQAAWEILRDSETRRGYVSSSSL